MNSVYSTILKACYKVESVFDKTFLSKDVPMSDVASHGNWQTLIRGIGNKPGMRILEVGSREVVASSIRDHYSKAEFVGFDYYAGNNVDVVGDAHKLSTYFDEDEKFDIVFSTACFEHFAMPWVVATEMAKMLNVGGHVFVCTHFAFSSHERPWHFFHFTDMALKTLFSEALGFECIEAGMSNPIVGRFSSLADKHMRNKRVRGLYCHSQYFGKKIREVTGFDWGSVNLSEVVGDTRYPEPKAA